MITDITQEQEEGESGGAMGETLSPDEKKLMDLLRSMQLAGKKIDAGKFMRVMKEEEAQEKYEDENWGKRRSMSSTPRKRVKSENGNDKSGFHYPKLLRFYGEEGKGEASWQKFRFDLEELIRSDVYDEDELMFGIRRALMGKAGEKLTRMGHGVTVQQLMSEFESEYGSVDTKRTILAKLYNCKQGEKESITDYTARLENLYAQAIRLEAVGTDESLQDLLFSGLREEFSLRADYKNETIQDYHLFKLELRKIENKLNPTTKGMKTDTTANAAINAERDKKDSEIKALLEQLNAKIDQISKEKDEMKKQLDDMKAQQQNPQFFNYTPRPKYRGNMSGARGSQPYRGQGRGNNQYRPQRPIAGNDFAPQQPVTNGNFTPRVCYNCNKPGHIARNCPKV